MRVWMTATLVLVMAWMSVGAVGCVSQQEVDRYQALYRKAEERAVELRRELELAEQELDALRAQQADTRAGDEELERLRAERDELSAALAEAEAQLREMGSPLEIPAELSDRLADLAADYPDLMTYDPDLGMVQLQSDLTFDLGSADVRDGAQASLQRLADVLRSDDAQAFEIRVVGHTDSVPIGRPETRENHPTNWHLSAHRAIAVKDVLESAGISPQRFNVAGYGQYRPVVSEDPGQGAEENRRVEIYLVPMTEREQRQVDRVSRAGGQGQGQRQSQSQGSGQAARTSAPQAEDPGQFK